MKNIFFCSNFRRLFLVLVLFVAISVKGQMILYPQHFNLNEVTLLDSPFKTAMDKNFKVLMEYDVDRLLTPFIRQAGLSNTTDTKSRYYQWEAKHPSFKNWGWYPSFTLEGHIGGHYLTALSLAYAACHDPIMKNKFKERLDSMVVVLKDCQDVYKENVEGLQGYIGGIPDNSVWTKLYQGDYSQYQARGGWVPFYVMHKIYAGLRDAYVYAGNKTAKDCFFNLCDWGINVVSKFSDSQMQSNILCNEQGGMDEVYADAYKMSGDKKYLETAKNFSHEEMVDGMQKGYSDTFLDYKHANTQVPKYIGFDRISELDKTSVPYRIAALNFWEDVVDHRTVCIGGNSIDEHFLAKDKCESYITNSDGPESCNTNNMLKLSEDLFEDTHAAKYVDFYEDAMLNHILSTQDPVTGGYVYFTSLRPQSYRIYSKVNEAMWCCVGTGMENHSKYGHFIYTHSLGNDTLFVNLFIASKLKNKKFVVEQRTSFPYSTSSVIQIGKSGKYTLALRHPSWATDNYKVIINGNILPVKVTKGIASYVYVNRSWSVGDKIEVIYPMALTFTECPNYTNYIAFNYGPVLLGASTTSSNPSSSNYEKLLNEYAGEGRMDHAPESMAAQKNLTSAPMLLCNRSDVLKRIKIEDTSKLLFNLDVSGVNSKWKRIELSPFYSIHHTRYMVYWNQQTFQAYRNSDLAKQESVAEILKSCTLDEVAAGEQQSEAGHSLQSKYSGKGVFRGEFYRNISIGNWVQYTLKTNGIKDSVSLMCRFNSIDKGRVCTIYIDGKKLEEAIVENIPGNKFYEVAYNVPVSYLTDDQGRIKTSIDVKFCASQQVAAPGLYYLRLLKGYKL
jgi:uncharacterized protein